MPHDKKRPRSGEALSFSTVNWVLLIAGILTVALGYVLLRGGSTVAAPLLLVLGYVVLLPASLIL
jgi:hypothetical protein